MIMVRPVQAPEKVERGESCLVLLHPPGPDIGRRLALSNPAYLVGRDAEADIVVGFNSVSRHHARIASAPDGAWWVHDLGSTNGSFVNEQKVVSQELKDGDQVRFGEVIYKFLSGGNIERAYHEEIYRMTILDGLTGVHNKRYFLDFLERELSVASRYGHPLTLVIFDVDHFKKVNDTYGHLAGDAVLKDLSGRIKTRIRREDLFARYGGEEFACVLPSTALAGGVVFAEQLRVLVAERPCQFEKDAIPFTISLGLASVKGEDKASCESIIARADEKLYEAKRTGRNRVCPSLADLVG
jgi:diguanylate cyclase (GGDEF)-like protein